MDAGGAGVRWIADGKETGMEAPEFLAEDLPC